MEVFLGLSLAAVAARAALRHFLPLRRKTVGPLSGRFNRRSVRGGVSRVVDAVRSSRRGGGEEGMVRRSPAMELLPLRGRRSRGRRRLLPVWYGSVGSFSCPDAASSFLQLAQGLAGRHRDRRRPAVVALEAKVVFGHGSASEREGSRRGCERVSVAVVVDLSGAPSTLVGVLMILTNALWRFGLPSPAWVVPVVQRSEFIQEFQERSKTHSFNCLFTGVMNL